MADESSDTPLISLDAARERIANAARPLPSTSCTIEQAIGCRLATPVIAEIDWPEADVSMMDGYAVAAADFAASRECEVAFEVAAGAVPPALPSGLAARIFTGAMLPAGADAVIRQEDVTRIGDSRVRLPATRPGQFVRKRGEVARAGATLAEVGTLVTPQLAVLLITVANPTVTVTPKPRIAILSTGNEVVAPDEPREPGKLRDGNSTMLRGFALAAGYSVVQKTKVGDDLTTTRDALASAFETGDVVLSTGGVSVGDYDFLPEAIRDLGGDVLFHRVNIKPGRPALVARFQGKWLIALPGNPASALVGWCLFARPLCGQLAGTENAFAARSDAVVVANDFTNKSNREWLALARRDEESHARLIEAKGSHDIVALATAEMLVRVPPNTTIRAGETAEAITI